MILLSLTAVCALQIPSPPQAPPPRALDEIQLKNGDTLQGRITTEIDGYVEVELEAGAVLGLGSAQIAAIRRGAVPVPAGLAVVAPRGEWFVLHDATGQAVGWLVTSVTQRADGGFTVNEEYEFQNGPRRYQVTAQASADPSGAPVRCYYRERVSEPVLALLQAPGADPGAAHDRVVDERIVEATVRGERLGVQHLDRNGRHERDVAWPAAASFPLLLRTLARARGDATGSATLFDPATEEFVVRAYDGSRQRSVVLDGKTVRVTEVAETTATGRNAEWLDASLRTLRRELAGPALVALPSSAGSARLAVGAATIAGAIVPEAGGGFGLWVPNPAWTPRQDLPPGQVVLVNEAHGASVTLTRLDHLEASTPLAAAVDSVANWFALLQPELTIDERTDVQLRDRAAMRLSARGRRADGPARAVLDVIPHQGHFLVLTCQAPERAWEELAEDFAFLSRTIELDAQSLAPKLQGPLAERAKRQRPATAPRPSSPRPAAPRADAPRHGGPRDVVPTAPAAARRDAAVPPEGSARPPVVRIPNGG